MTRLQPTPEQLQKIYQIVGLRALASNTNRFTEWLSVRCKELTLTSVDAYINRLLEPLHVMQEREALCHLLTSRESYFLRDRGVLDVLREHILKEILEKKMMERSLNIWSIGCATGEEVYTLSIFIQEAIPDVGRWRVDILGSDIDQVALTQARQGAYRQWSFRGCPAEFIARYFIQEGSNLKITNPIKQSVRFEHLDILAAAYPNEHQGMAHADIIVCRNVFIYLDDASIEIALKKITSCLTEGGYFFCGPGELHLQEHPQLVPLIFAQALVYQKKTTSDSTEITEMSSTSESPPPLQISTKRAEAFTPQTQKYLHPSLTLADAWRLANLGHVSAANRICKNVIQQDRLNPHAHYLHAVLNFAKGMTTQAREDLRRVLYLDPLFAVAYAMLSDVCMADHDTDCALKACRQGLKATHVQANDQTVPYFNSVSYQEFRQHL